MYESKCTCTNHIDKCHGHASDMYGIFLTALQNDFKLYSTVRICKHSVLFQSCLIRAFHAFWYLLLHGKVRQDVCVYMRWRACAQSRWEATESLMTGIEKPRLEKSFVELHSLAAPSW